MQVTIVATLEEDTFDNVVAHCKQAEENLKKIFSATDPGLSVKFWYSTDGSDGLTSLNIALIALKGSAVVYFCKGWEKHRETSMLHYICEAYGIQRMEE